jgi:hypothetical protein
MVISLKNLLLLLLGGLYTAHLSRTQHAPFEAVNITNALALGK